VIAGGKAPAGLLIGNGQSISRPRTVCRCGSRRALVECFNTNDNPDLPLDQYGEYGGMGDMNDPLVAREGKRG